MPQKYRSLTAREIRALTSQGCTCSDWLKITVAPRFNSARIRDTHFSGAVSLGVAEKDLSFYGGVKKPSGISSATLHNCTIGNNVYIKNISNHIANYVIEDNVVIENVDICAVEGTSRFGNGTSVSVLIESGGREIPIYDRLSAHEAYIIALYRHRPEVVRRITSMIMKYADSVASDKGCVGTGARLINSRIIKNMKIGAHAVVEGVNIIENGTVNSCKEDPVYIGPGVIASNFIVNSGSQISQGAIITACFIGQGCTLSKQYSAENSVFFANCGGFHGEAWSIFAGPYTVTHHKSTLLISGLVSFLNAGSGSNQSNHMYKLGPIHQGILERGSKTTSDSYILWPAKVGPFTLVMGRHYRNSDTSDLPYSYLIEHEDESILVPGVNLRSVGTIRDARKWPTRDKRKDPHKLDHINFNLLSPYSIQRMINGVSILNHLKETSGQTSEYYSFNGVKIRHHSLVKGIELYEIGIIKLLGNALVNRLKSGKCKTIEEVRKCLAPTTEAGKGKWIDLAGMFAPEEIVDALLNDVADGSIGSLEKLRARFDEIHHAYHAYCWSWVIDKIEKRLHKSCDQITARDVMTLTKQWVAAVIKLDKALIEDAKKEFAVQARIGFGLDGDDEVMQRDFEAVRGDFEKNSFVHEIEEHMEKKSALAEELIATMKKIKK